MYTALFQFEQSFCFVENLVLSIIKYQVPSDDKTKSGMAILLDKYFQIKSK